MLYITARLQLSSLNKIAWGHLQYSIFVIFSAKFLFGVSRTDVTDVNENIRPFFFFENHISPAEAQKGPTN